MFNCFSNKRDYSNYFLSITCTTLFSNPVYDAGSYYNLDRLVLSSCHKIYNVRLPDDIVNGENYFSLTWSELTCGSCEKEGKKCRLKSNVGKELETECIDKLNSFLYNWSASLRVISWSYYLLLGVSFVVDKLYRNWILKISKQKET